MVSLQIAFDCFGQRQLLDLIETNGLSHDETAKMLQAFQFVESRQRLVQLDREANLLLALSRPHVVVDARLRVQYQIIHQTGHRLVGLVRMQVEVEEAGPVLDASVENTFGYSEAQA